VGIQAVIEMTLALTVVLLFNYVLSGRINSNFLVSYAVALAVDFESTLAVNWFLFGGIMTVLSGALGYLLYENAFDFFPALYASIQEGYAEFQGNHYHVLIQYLKSIPASVTELNLSDNALGELPMADLLNVLHAIPSTVKSVVLTNNHLFDHKSDEEQQVIREVLDSRLDNRHVSLLHQVSNGGIFASSAQQAETLDSPEPSLSS